MYGETYERACERLGYDLAAALEENSLGHRLADLDSVRLEITGERDELAWHWLCAKVGGGWAYVTGSCDYTGWDCQSGAEIHDADTMDEALALVGEVHRAVFRDMLAKGETKRRNQVDW